MFTTRVSMIARLLMLGAATLTMGAQTSCSGSSDGRVGFDDPILDSGDGPTFVTTLALKNSAGDVTTRFRRGELITYELTVRNRTDAAATVHFSSGAQSDFLAFDSGTRHLRWRWSEGKAFIQVLTDLTFQPREVRTFKFDWDQVLASGAMLEAGEYEARGMLPQRGADPNPLAPDELASTLVAFTITR